MTSPTNVGRLNLTNRLSRLLNVPKDPTGGSGGDTKTLSVQPTSVVSTSGTSAHETRNTDSLCEEIFSEWTAHYDCGKSWSEMSEASRWSVVDLAIGYPPQAIEDLRLQGLGAHALKSNASDDFMLGFILNGKPMVSPDRYFSLTPAKLC